MKAGAHESDPTIREVEGGLDAAVSVEEFRDQRIDGGFDAAQGGVTDRIVAGGGNEGVRFFPKEEDLFDLVATGAVEDGVVKVLNLESSPGECEISAGETLLSAL